MKPLPADFQPQRIALIKPSAVGDVIHALPILDRLRAHWPAAKISWIVTPACSGILQDHPMIEEIILFDRKRYAAWWRSSSALRALRGFTRQLRAKRFDLVLDLQGLLRSGWMAWMTGARVRLGFANAREGAPIFYTHRVPVQTMEQHAVDRYRTMLDYLG